MTARIDFRPAALLAEIRRRAVQPLGRGAADVRRFARQLIRPGGTSAPGTPPRSHTDLLRRLIVYHVDNDHLRATIGPLASLRTYPNGDRKPIGATVPSVLEFGGTIQVREMLLARGWIRETPRRAAQNNAAARRLRMIRIEPRPYMRPALDMAAAQLVNHFRNLFDQ